MISTDPLSTLGEIIWTASRADESTISATGANVIARAILASEWLTAHTAAAKRAGAEAQGRLMHEFYDQGVKDGARAVVEAVETVDVSRCRCTCGERALAAAHEAAARYVEGNAPTEVHYICSTTNEPARRTLGGLNVCCDHAECPGNIHRADESTECPHDAWTHIGGEA